MSVKALHEAIKLTRSAIASIQIVGRPLTPMEERAKEKLEKAIDALQKAAELLAEPDP